MYFFPLNSDISRLKIEPGPKYRLTIVWVPWNWVLSPVELSLSPLRPSFLYTYIDDGGSWKIKCKPLLASDFLILRCTKEFFLVSIYNFQMEFSSGIEWLALIHLLFFSHQNKVSHVWGSDRKSVTLKRDVFCTPLQTSVKTNNGTLFPRWL